MKLKKIFTVLATLVLALSIATSAMAYDDPYAAVEAELQRLYEAALALPDNFKNPSPAQEKFNHDLRFGQNKNWQMSQIVGGGEIVTGETAFHNSSMDVVRRSLRLSQSPDLLWESEDEALRYNNAALIGFTGYMPTAKKDVSWKFRMKIGEDFYGTTGFYLQPEGTLAPDGNFQLPADWIGFSYAGPENIYSAGLQCNYFISWMPLSSVPVEGVDPFQWNDYEIRLSQISKTESQATLRVNGNTVCEFPVANFGPMEIQLWADNYLALPDPNDPYNVILTYNNKDYTQEVWFDDFTVKAVPGK